MNNDLISRSALLELAHNHIGGTVDCNDIARFPAVDAEPVRHGWWKSSGNFLECSECGHEYTQYDWEGSIVGYYYCPNCGTKMHIEVEG